MGVPVRVAACTAAGIVLSGLIAAFGFVHAAPTSGMNLQPSSVVLSGVPGQTIKLDVMIGEAADVGGFTFQFLFNGTYLNVDDIRSTFFQSRQADVVCFENILDDIAAFGCVILGKPGVSGSGVLASIDLTVKAVPPVDQVLLQNCAMADSQGNLIPLEKCTGATLLLPTPTPTPTPTPRPVGGVSRSPDRSALPQTAPQSASDARVVVAVAAALGGMAVAAAGLTWRARRR